MSQIGVKRVYHPLIAEDGVRVPVDRLWLQGNAVVLQALCGRD